MKNDIEIERRIIEFVKLNQPCKSRDFKAVLSEFRPEDVERCQKRLSQRSGGIVNVGTKSNGVWKLADPEEKRQPRIRQKKPDPKPHTMTNITPGRLVSKMEGVWAPPKTLLRHDAEDSNSCMSLSQGVRKPYTGRPMTLGVRGK